MQDCLNITIEQILKIMGNLYDEDIAIIQEKTLPQKPVIRGTPEDILTQKEIINLQKHLRVILPHSNDFDGIVLICD